MAQTKYLTAPPAAIAAELKPTKKPRPVMVYYGHREIVREVVDRKNEQLAELRYREANPKRWWLIWR